MKRNTKLKLTIPQPCTQKWNEMQQVESGRFCNACSKTLMDFSGFSDAQLLEFFSSTEAKHCGRFTPHQLDRKAFISSAYIANHSPAIRHCSICTIVATSGVYRNTYR